MSERLYTVLRAPHISEKASLKMELNNQYVFKVSVDATKAEVKAAVEKLFDVKVEGVQTLNMKGKVKRNRYGYSRKPSWKKAYVSLQQGQTIDFATA